MFDSLITLAQKIIDAFSKKPVLIATAESCTGGLVSALLTEVPGASLVLDRGFVTYSNEAKNEMLGVPMDLIKECGAVSEEVARAMAEGALKYSRADIAISLTGIAGPDGGTPKKPVGLVHMACAIRKDWTITNYHFEFSGSRMTIRQSAAKEALDILFRQMENL